MAGDKKEGCQSSASADTVGRMDVPAASSTRAHLPVSISVRGLDFFYGAQQALHGISLDVPKNCVTALIGPSGCGKSTLLRCFNRMNDRVPGATVRSGSIVVEGWDVLAPGLDVVSLRRQVGMVFQKSNPFPVSIFENVAYGLKIQGETRADYVEHRVEESLRATALWDEVKDQLSSSARTLSGGQQQRLCIARAIALRPRVLLMDEPCSALDPVATACVEDLIHELKRQFTVVIVTHHMQQAMRTSDFTAFFYMGRLIEHSETLAFFENPKEKMSLDYVTGRFG